MWLCDFRFGDVRFNCFISTREQIGLSNICEFRPSHRGAAISLSIYQLYSKNRGCLVFYCPKVNGYNALGEREKQV
jgi:hypothetical protein